MDVIKANERQKAKDCELGGTRVPRDFAYDFHLFVRQNKIMKVVLVLESLVS